MAPRRGTPARKGTGTQEMTFLADLIGGDEITDDAASAAAKMNLTLFGDEDSDAAGGGGGDTQSQVRAAATRVRLLQMLESELLTRRG